MTDDWTDDKALRESYPAEMSTHIPGPWSAHIDGDDWFIKAPDPEEPEIPWDVAKMTRYCGYDGDTSEANARLIASAPDLLEALKAARKELEECSIELTGEDYNNPAMNDLISRAEGHTPTGEGG